MRAKAAAVTAAQPGSASRRGANVGQPALVQHLQNFTKEQFSFQGMAFLLTGFEEADK